MVDPPELSELEALYSSLTLGERDELLQCLLVAAPHGEEAMVEVLEDLLLCQATEELLAQQMRGSAEK